MMNNYKKKRTIKLHKNFEKLIFYFMFVVKNHQPISKMSSFKDELTATVNTVRKNIKIEAINYFIHRLKTSMRWTAERGETRGRISLAINFMNEDDDDEGYVVLRKLNDLLLLKEVKRTKVFEGTKIYEWILKTVE